MTRKYYGSSYEVDTEDVIKLTISFYNKNRRNNLNSKLRNLSSSINVELQKVWYNDYDLPVVEKDDKTLKCYNLNILFYSKDDRSKMVKLLRKESEWYG